MSTPPRLPGSERFVDRVGGATGTDKDTGESRFIQTPAQTVKKQLGERLKSLETDAEKLTKRLTYLETTHKNSMEHVEKILAGGRRS